MNTLLKNIVLAPFNMLYRVSPSLTLRVLFRLKQGYSLNLDNPRTYSEKIQWVKLYDRNPLMPVCADKYAVRSYVEERGCGDLLNELYWHGNNPADIPFDDLPEKYVVKATHGSTYNWIVDGPSAEKRDEIEKSCRKWLDSYFLPCYGEWFYDRRESSIEPSIVVEKFLDPDEGDLDDYKVFVFSGKAAYVLVCTGRSAGHHEEALYTEEWKRIEGGNTGYPCCDKDIPIPVCLDEMIAAAEKLAEPFRHARVDFYIVDGRPVFGEITFTSGSGFDRYSSYELDLEMGELFDLS